MKRFDARSKEELALLPTDIQTQVLETLKAYACITVTYEYGKYTASTGTMLKEIYAPDYRVFGTFYQDDIYSLDERTENYIECFHDYPNWYKGPRDYAELRRRFM